jgi:uncharacterized protein YecT (DUF1311 family)
VGQTCQPDRMASVPDFAGRTRLARAAVSAALAAALAGALAACGGPAPSGNGSATPPAPATSSSASPPSPANAPAGPATASPGGTQFSYIVEPFDPGHPAENRSAPASCAGQTSTVAIEQCLEAKTEIMDAAIDAAQLARYDSGSQAQRAAILADDSAWLSAREPVCAEAFRAGGTIDGINVASCLLDESTARLDAVRGISPPAATLKATDSTDPTALAWYTTPGGARIAMADTQGDQSGGTIISWVVIGGAGGFSINPSQFYYRDGSYTNHGVVQAPNPSGHPVPAGAEYDFSIDYPHLSADPNAARGTGGYAYAPSGVLAATWR